MNKSYKKFARKIAKFEATLLTQRLVPNDSGLTQTEPLSVGLGAGKDLLFESILGRCVSSNKKSKVKNGYYVKSWWGAHIPIRTNGPNQEWIYLPHDEIGGLHYRTRYLNRIPQIFSNLGFTKLWAYYLIVNISNFCAGTSKGWNQYYTIICEVEPLFSIFFKL